MGKPVVQQVAAPVPAEVRAGHPCPVPTPEVRKAQAFQVPHPAARPVGCPPPIAAAVLVEAAATTVKHNRGRVRVVVQVNPAFSKAAVRPVPPLAAHPIAAAPVLQAAGRQEVRPRKVVLRAVGVQRGVARRDKPGVVCLAAAR